MTAPWRLERLVKGVELDHPLLTELEGFVDGTLKDADRSSVRAHLNACATCRIAIRHADAPVPTPSVEVEAITVLESLFNYEGEPLPEPAAGQLWRFRWEDVASLGVVLRVHEEEVTVAPVCLDSWLADEYAVFVSEEWSPIDVSLAIWVSLVTTVPLCVLDWYLGEVDVLDQLPAVRDAFVKGLSPPSHIPTGAAVVSTLDERSQFRRQLATTFSDLSDAGWYEPSISQGDGDLGKILDGLEPERIGESLGLEPPSVFVLLRGETPLTESQAAQLSALSGIAVDVLRNASPPIPSRLLRELDHPINRSLIEECAIRNRWSFTEVRFEARNALLGRAARFEGDPDAPIDWRRMLRDWLDA